RAPPSILRHEPSAVEVMDRFILDHARESPALDALRRSILQTEPGALLCVEFYADDAAALPAKLEALERELARSPFPCRWRRALTASEQARIWSLREAALGLSMAMKGDDKSLSFVEDTAVAPEKLRDYIDRFRAIVRRHGTTAGVYAHASVGCLHVRPVINLKTADGVRRFEAIANDIADLVLEYGGALSGEHGDGLVRSPFTEKMFGATLYQAFRTLKKTFDPDTLFNPGKIVDSPPLTANLRYGPTYDTPDPPTFFDFSAHDGMGRAVEMCSGLGACRKTLDGTMCPSYMATLEEKHSTRGRANALRLAMAGRLGESGLHDEDIHEVLDLCLECRACKTECPVGVDVARFKSEFLAAYWKRHGVPWRARAVGHIHTLSKWGSRFAPASNLAAGSAAGRWVGEKLFQIDRRRRLPAWTRETFARRFAARQRAQLVADACALFEDFVEREWQAGRVALRLRDGPPAVLLHGHCHQKAMGLQASARALLSRIPSSTVVDLDAGCCGMAGSFGYAREHYHVSRQIGERRLLPAARAMHADGVLAAAGVSCRQQVSHFTGVRAVHPAVLLRSLLETADSR